MGIAQYQIVLVNLDLTQGSEIKKTRPCVIISPDEMNAPLRTVIVAPMTTSGKAYPTRIPIHHGGKDGCIALDQIRTIDKGRIMKSFRSLEPREISAVKSVLKEMLVR